MIDPLPWNCSLPRRIRWANSSTTEANVASGKIEQNGLFWDRSMVLMLVMSVDAMDWKEFFVEDFLPLAMETGTLWPCRARLTISWIPKDPLSSAVELRKITKR